jgi:hypothetical protein
MTADAQSLIAIELAKQFLEFMLRLEPRWSRAFFRYYKKEFESGSNGSCVADAKIKLISAFENSAFFREMNEKSERLFAALGKSSGVLLLTVTPDHNYDIQFEWNDTRRWYITKLNGKSGLPEGIQ